MDDPSPSRVRTALVLNPIGSEASWRGRARRPENVERHFMKMRHWVFTAATPIGLFTSIHTATAQMWTLIDAPITNWTAIACSADGSKLVATATGSIPRNEGPQCVRLQAHDAGRSL